MAKLVLCLVASILMAAPAWAETPSAAPPPGITPQQAQQALDVLQDPAKLRQLIETLQTVARAAPASAVPAKPAGEAPQPGFRPGSLGSRLLTTTATFLADFSDQIVATVQTLTRFPRLWGRLEDLAHDPTARAEIADAAWRFLLVLGGAFAAEWVVAYLLQRRRTASELAGAEAADAPRAEASQRFLRRLPLALLRSLVELLPIGAFALAVALLIALLDAKPQARSLVLTFLEAYVLARLIMVAVRFFVSAAHPRLRLLRLSDAAAVYTEGWARRLTVVAVFGAALSQAALTLGFNAAADDALLKIVTLILDGCLVAIVLQCRTSVSAAIGAPQGAGRVTAILRNRLAAVWHYVALFLIVASWAIWAVAWHNGLSRVLEIGLASAAILILARLVAIVLLGALDHLFRLGAETQGDFRGLEQRAGRYRRPLHMFISVVISLIALVFLLDLWGVDAIAWLGNGSIGGSIVSALAAIAVTVVIAVIVWEAANAAIDRHLAGLSAGPARVRAARVRTVLPILRTTLLIAILTVVVLTALSEIGVNIAPLLAGAGIVGIAVGFGSQKLVQDLINGLFLLLENAVQVGDWVTVSGLSGTVEDLSIRTIRLRASDGSVHIVPFSSVTSVTNANRGIGNASVSVNVVLAEDIDKVSRALKEIAAEMRADPQFGPLMLRDLELWGVDKVDGKMFTVAGQIVCTDAGRWPVQREFNRRMKIRFQELGIALALPS